MGHRYATERHVREQFINYPLGGFPSMYLASVDSCLGSMYFISDALHKTC